jgi:hypothetical protein
MTAGPASARVGLGTDRRERVGTSPGARLGASLREHPRLWLLLAVGFVAGILVRAALLPQPGLAGDLDEFASWVHALAVRDLTRAYDIDLTFPPVMVYVWAAIAHLDPVFRTATDASDPGVRVVMKLVPTLADLGLAVGVGWLLRARPAWAVVAALGIWLHPAVIDVSALFGQYESIYVLFGLFALILVIGGRSGLAAVALGMAAMTKPQALPLLVPFAAWFLAIHGWRRTLRLAAIGAVTIVVLWLPFLAAGGPGGYLRSIGLHQDQLFGVLSLRAWNAWWVIQDIFGGGASFISDQAKILGPITFRYVGYAVAGVLELAVFIAVLRFPTRRTLALGLAASVLVAFCFLTTMHERYAYGALVFLAVLINDRRMLGLWLVFGAVFTLNLLAAIPPTPEIGAALPIFGVLGTVGSVAMVGVTLATVVLLFRSPPGEAPKPPDERDAIPMQVVR